MAVILPFLGAMASAIGAGAVAVGSGVASGAAAAGPAIAKGAAGAAKMGAGALKAAPGKIAAGGGKISGAFQSAQRGVESVGSNVWNQTAGRAGSYLNPKSPYANYGPNPAVRDVAARQFAQEGASRREGIAKLAQGLTDVGQDYMKDRSSGGGGAPSAGAPAPMYPAAPTAPPARIPIGPSYQDPEPDRFAYTRRPYPTAGLGIVGPPEQEPWRYPVGGPQRGYDDRNVMY